MIDALVAGHVCLDIIPELSARVAFEPGRLIEAGPATVSTGGTVSNCGLALLKLGIETRLIGKVGEDLLAVAVRSIFDGQREGLGASIETVPGGATSYTVVVNLTGEDRMFLHSPGCNATFVSADVPDDALAQVRHFHFGYPPLMASMYADDGRELADLFRRAKEAGATTSLDMSLPDSNAASGQADWTRIFERVLPYVDVFLPSVEELLFSIERPTFERLRGAVLGHLPTSLIDRLATRAMGMGAKMLGIKVGARGFYLKTAADLSGFGRVEVEPEWAGRTLWHPCYRVEVAGTTGAGDATIAGFLMGLLRGFDPMAACQAAVAVGACCCERLDAVSGVLPWTETVARVDAGWPLLLIDLEPGWRPLGSGYVRG